MSDSFHEKATQGNFAKLVGVSQPAINKLSKRIGLTPGGTLEDWLRTYCEHLRTEAAGRGGDSMVSLTRQRILESEQKTLAMSMDNMERAGKLVITEDVARIFDEWTSAVPISFNGAAEKILGAIESKYSVSIDDELVQGPIRGSIERIAGVARKLSEDIRQGS